MHSGMQTVLEIVGKNYRYRIAQSLQITASTQTCRNNGPYESLNFCTTTKDQEHTEMSFKTVKIKAEDPMGFIPFPSAAMACKAADLQYSPGQSALTTLRGVQIPALHIQFVRT
jgi:hypothetical protein